MITFYSEAHLCHDVFTDWEMPARGERIRQAIEKAHLGEIRPPHDFGMAPLQAIHADGLLHLLQTAYKRMQALSTSVELVIPESFAVRHLAHYQSPQIWGELGYYASDRVTPIGAGTWQAVYEAVQVALSAAHHTWQYRTTTYALCRPPGHHAYADLYGGYCYLNNCAVAAHWLTQQGANVAIVDVDYHHGNGTQAIFYNRPDVLFCSIHADPHYDYPYYCGFDREKGIGAGMGYNHNVPLLLGTTGTQYLAILESVLDKVASFAPDVLLISLGVDTAEGDPNGGFLLGEGDFAGMGALFAQLALPTVVIQEGGYQLECIGRDVVAFLQAIDKK